MIPREKKRKWKNNELDGVDIEEQWLEHIKNFSIKFPRDIGFPYRKVVETEDEFLSEIRSRISSDNIYTNVYSKTMINNNVYSTFFLDIDGNIDINSSDTSAQKEKKFDNAIGDAWWEVRKIVWVLEDNYDLIPRVYFSGSRGFAVYIDFKPVNVDFRVFVSTIKDILSDADIDHSLLDESVFEKNRISRIPYTMNFNNLKRHLSPMLCIPVDPGWAEDIVLEEIKNPTRQKEVEIEQHEGFAEELEARDSMTEFEDPNEFDPDEYVEDPERALEEAKKAMDAAEKINDGRHRILHFVIVPNLIEAGFDSDSIHAFCREFIEETGASYIDYQQDVSEGIERTLEGPPGQDTTWKAWSWEKLLTENSDILDYLV